MSEHIAKHITVTAVTVFEVLSQIVSSVIDFM